MKCNNCDKKMTYTKSIDFNGFKIDGYSCTCGEVYFDPEQAQRVLLLNKLKKEAVKAKLGKNRSNLILRLPQDMTTALSLHKGEEVLLTIEDKGIKMMPA